MRHNILSLAVLLKAGYKVEFRVGTDLDSTDGGDLYTPKGKRIALVFSGNLWRLPMWSSPSRCESTAGIPAHQNPFAALLNIPENVACTRAASQPSEVSPLELSVADQIRLCHDRDGHLSYNTHLRMYKSREGRGYPANFPSLLAHFKCETCAVTLGARTYRTSKRVQDKGYHTKRQQESEVILTSTTTCSPLKCACCAPSEGGLPDTSRQATCLARASQPKKKRRKSKKAKGTVIAARAEASPPPLVAVVAPRLVHLLSIVCILTTLTVVSESAVFYHRAVRALSFMWTGRAELLTSPIIPVTSPGIEPTVDFCDSAVFYHRAINATRPCGMNSWIHAGFSHPGIVPCTRLHTSAPRPGVIRNEPTELIFVRARSFTIVLLMQQDRAE
jgi:hypothetical protein